VGRGRRARHERLASFSDRPLVVSPPNAGPARTALPAAHFERNDVTIICETVH
jgi:hypothetical protein